MIGWVVLAGIPIGVGGVIGAYFRYYPSWQLQRVCETHLRAVGAALDEYWREYERYPPSLSALVEAGPAMDSTCRCPFVNGASSTKIDYAYVSGLRPDDLPSWIVAFDRAGNHPDTTRNVLYVSGAVRRLTEGEFDRDFARFAAEFAASRGAAPIIVRDR